MKLFFCCVLFCCSFPLPAQDEISLDHIDNLDIYNDELFYQEWYLFSNAAERFFSMSSSDFTQELVRGEFFLSSPRELASTMILTEEVNFSELFEPFLTNKIESSFDNCKDII